MHADYQRKTTIMQSTSEAVSNFFVNAQARATMESVWAQKYPHEGKLKLKEQGTDRLLGLIYQKASEGQGNLCLKGEKEYVSYTQTDVNKGLQETTSADGVIHKQEIGCAKVSNTIHQFKTKVYIFIRPTIFGDETFAGEKKLAGHLREVAHVESEREEWLPPFVSPRFLRGPGYNLQDEAIDIFGTGSGNPFSAAGY